MGVAKLRQKVSSLGRAGYHFKRTKVEDKERERENEREREEWYKRTEKIKNKKGGLRESRKRMKKEFKREKQGMKKEK